MKVRSSPRLSVTILITVLAALLATLGSVVGNIATSSIPGVLLPYVRFAWPLLGVIFVFGIGVSIWQVRREALSDSEPPPKNVASSSSRESLPFPVPVSTPHPQGASSGYHSCVLSYATEDQTFVEKLYRDLQSAGVSCWFAPHDLKAGEKLRDTIYAAIRKSEKLLLVLSEHAVMSDWVEREVELSFEREHQPPETLVLFPIRIDDAVMQTDAAWAGDIRRMRFIGDFRAWQDEQVYQQALRRLLRDLHV